MRIGLDITPLTRERTGVGTYVFHLLRRMLVQAEETEFRGLATGIRQLDVGALGSRLAARRIRIPTRIMYGAWRALGYPRADRILGGVDVYHATNYFLPPTDRARRVLSIYDLAFLAHPEWCSPRVVGPFSRSIRRFAREADAVVTCSEHSKRDIVRLTDTDPAKVTVAFGAVDDTLARSAHALRSGSVAQEVVARHGIRRPYFLFVGTIEPRKNVAALVRAFGRLLAALPHQLVLVGPAGWESSAVLDAAGQLGARAVRTGFVPSEDLAPLYAAATAFVFPSRYEGFGLPVLEAMACGCPVIAGDNSAIPEVAGDAAILVDAEDDVALMDAMQRVAEDEALRTRLAARGRQQAAGFTWDACARTTLEVYRGLAAC